jgi:opacity protein-like surface antigen
MRILGLAAAVFAAHAGVSGQASAQTGFDGAYVGVETGFSDRQLTAIESAISIPEDPTDFIGVEVGDDEFAYGVFAGWGATVNDHVYLGAELGVGNAGDEIAHDINADLSLTIEPQWRVSAAGRLGIVVGDASLVYAKLGYETREYELRTNEGFVATNDVGGILYGIGFERMVGERLSIRAEVARVDVGADDSEFELGLSGCSGPDPGTCEIFPVRFALEPEETRAVVGAAIRF